MLRDDAGDWIKTMKTIFASVLLVLIQTHYLHAARPCDADSQNITVIRAVLETLDKGDGILVVTTETDSPVDLLAQFENTAGGLTVSHGPAVNVSKDLWQAFRRKNKTSTPLHAVPALPNVMLLSFERLRQLIPDSSDASWNQFRHSWPQIDAIVRLTTPAISMGRTALLYVTVTRGPLHGEGILYVLANSDGRWRIETKTVVVAS